MLCTLVVSENKCPYLADDKQHCSATNSGCSFRKSETDKPVISREYVRKERWYEKYYH